jgi:hypothetical protein
MLIEMPVDIAMQKIEKAIKIFSLEQIQSKKTCWNKNAAIKLPAY